MISRMVFFNSYSYKQDPWDEVGVNVVVGVFALSVEPLGTGVPLKELVRERVFGWYAAGVVGVAGVPAAVDAVVSTASAASAASVEPVGCVGTAAAVNVLGRKFRIR